MRGKAPDSQRNERESGSDSRGNRGAHSRYRIDGDFALHTGVDQLNPRVRNSGSAGICNQRDLFASLQTPQQLGKSASRVVFVKAQRWSGNGVSCQKPGSSARILGRYQVHFAQYTERAQSDVFEVANRRRNDEESAGHFGDRRPCRRVSNGWLLYHRQDARSWTDETERQL